MAVALRAGSTFKAFGAATNTVLTAPSTIVNNDVLFIWFLTFESAGAAPVATPPTGFALFPTSPALPLSLPSITTDHMSAWAWYKVASSESGNYTVTHTAATGTVGWMAAYSGANSTTPVSVTGTSSTGNNPGAWSTTGVTTIADGSMVIFAGADWADTATAYTAPAATPPTFTSVQSTVNNNIYVADGVVSTAGATGSPVTTANNSATGDPFGCALLVIDAPSGSPPPPPGGPPVCYGSYFYQQNR